jgi:hemerythrin
MFEWKNEYSVNIASIDAQHKKLFAIAEELHEAIRTGHPQQIQHSHPTRMTHHSAI